MTTGSVKPVIEKIGRSEFRVNLLGDGHFINFQKDCSDVDWNFISILGREFCSKGDGVKRTRFAVLPDRLMARYSTVDILKTVTDPNHQVFTSTQ